MEKKFKDTYEFPSCPNFSLIFSQISNSTYLPAFESKSYRLIAGEVTQNDAPEWVEDELHSRVESAWEFFETDEHEYRYPRKVMKHIANLVAADNGKVASIQRALDYFDTNEMFSSPQFRAEANIALARSIENAELINKVVSLNAPLLDEMTAKSVTGSLETPQVAINNVLSLELQAAIVAHNKGLVDSAINRTENVLLPLLRHEHSEEDALKFHASYLYSQIAETCLKISYSQGFELTLSRVTEIFHLEEVAAKAIRELSNLNESADKAAIHSKLLERINQEGLDFDHIEKLADTLFGYAQEA